MTDERLNDLKSELTAKKALEWSVRFELVKVVEELEAARAGIARLKADNNALRAELHLSRPVVIHAGWIAPEAIDDKPDYDEDGE